MVEARTGGYCPSRYPGGGGDGIRAGPAGGVGFQLAGRAGWTRQAAAGTTWAEENGLKMGLRYGQCSHNEGSEANQGGVGES